MNPGIWRAHRLVHQWWVAAALAGVLAAGAPLAVLPAQSTATAPGRRPAFGYEAIVVDVQHEAMSAPLLGLSPIWRFRQPGRRVNSSLGFDVAFSSARERRKVCRPYPYAGIDCPIEDVRERGHWTAMHGGVDLAFWRPGRAEFAVLGHALLAYMQSRAKGLDTEQTDSRGGLHFGAVTGVEVRYQPHTRWLVTSRAVIGRTTSLFDNGDAHADHTFRGSVSHNQLRVGLSYLR